MNSPRAVGQCNGGTRGHVISKPESYSTVAMEFTASSARGWIEGYPKFKICASVPG